MINNPVSVDGYLIKWGFVAVVSDRTCPSYAGVFRQTGDDIYEKIAGSQVYLNPPGSSYTDRQIYNKSVDNQVVRVESGDFVAIYTDISSDSGCGSNVVSFRNNNPSDSTVTSPGDTKYKTLDFDVIDGRDGNLVLRGVALQAYVEGERVI